MQQPSRWQFRKQIQRQCRDHDKARIRYLESLLDLHGIDYDIAFSSGPHPLNLERYDEISLKHVGDVISDAIPQHTGHQPYRSAWASSPQAKTVEVSNQVMENGVPVLQTVVHEAVEEVVKPQSQSVCSPSRDKGNPMQCQICKELFLTRNALFQHLETKCMAGKMERTGLEDRAHRRRWKARARLRKASVRKEAKAVSHMDIDASRGGSIVEQTTPAIEVPLSGGDNELVVGTRVVCCTSSSIEYAMFDGCVGTLASDRGRGKWYVRFHESVGGVRQVLLPEGLFRKVLPFGLVASSVQEVPQGSKVPISVVQEDHAVLPDMVKDADGKPIEVYGNWKFEEGVELSDQCFKDGQRVWCRICRSYWGMTHDYKGNPYSGARPKAKYTWYGCATCTRPLMPP